jgi:hypothetical protein
MVNTALSPALTVDGSTVHVGSVSAASTPEYKVRTRTTKKAGQIDFANDFFFIAPSSLLNCLS